MEDETTSGIRSVLAASVYILFMMLVITVVAWIRIPEGQKIVIHWNYRGQADWYTSKAFGLLMLPVFTVILAGIFVLLTKSENLSSAKTIIWIAAMVPMVVVQGLIIWIALGRNADVSAVVSGIIGLLLIVIGNYFPKLRRNRLVGIRTPWTLSSELSWNKTHRLGGRLTVLYGLLILACSFQLDSIALLYVILAAGLPLVIFLSIYSYVIWKGDPDR